MLRIGTGAVACGRVSAGAPSVRGLDNSAKLGALFRNARLSRMASFLGSIGIEMRAGSIHVPTLFPGSLVSRGSLVIDESSLVAPGDALHEAAHIALAPPTRRSADFGYINKATGGEE